MESRESDKKFTYTQPQTSDHGSTPYSDPKDASTKSKHSASTTYADGNPNGKSADPNNPNTSDPETSDAKSSESASDRKFRIGKVSIPKPNIGKVELPKVELPKVDLKKVELPKVDLKKVGEKSKTSCHETMDKLNQGIQTVKEPTARLLGDMADKYKDQVVDFAVKQGPALAEQAYSKLYTVSPDRAKPIMDFVHPYVNTAFSNVGSAIKAAANHESPKTVAATMATPVADQVVRETLGKAARMVPNMNAKVKKSAKSTTKTSAGSTAKTSGKSTVKASGKTTAKK